MKAMEECKCDRCGYTTDSLSNLRRHLKRKTQCKGTETAMSFEEVCKKYLPPAKPKNIVCLACTKRYTTRQGLFLHQKNDKCRETSKSDKERLQHLEDVVTNMSNRLTEMQSMAMSYTTNHITNNSMTNVQNVQIVLNNYGSEDVSHLTHELLSHCLLNPSKGLPTLIDNIHYNPIIPSNHNIRYKSTKHNSFEKYVDRHWMECDTSNSLDELIRKGYRILNSHYSEHFMNNPEYTDNEIKQRTIERFRFLSDKTCTEYHSVKRELRLLVKDRTMFLLASPHNAVPQIDTVPSEISD
jgi:hypothetical protein